MKKRLVVPLLLLICTWFSACGGQPQPSAQAQPSASASETTQAAAAAPEEEAAADSPDATSTQTSTPQEPESNPTMADQYPEAYALFTEMYGSFFSVNEEGAFVLQWSEDTKAKLLLPSEQDVILYGGEELSVTLDSMENEVLYFHYTNHTADEIRIYSAKSEYSYIEVYADGLWWTVETDDVSLGDHSGVRREILGPGETAHARYLKVFDVSDQNVPISNHRSIPFPPGTYRYVRWLRPFADAALVLEFEIPEQVDAGAPSGQNGLAQAEARNMQEEYPNAYVLFTEMYGDFFRVNADGVFVLQWSEDEEAEPLLPSAQDVLVYDGTDLAAELKYIENDILYYQYINRTAEEISIYNGTRETIYTEVYVDDVWWPVDENYFAGNAAMYDYIEPGENAHSGYLRVFTEQNPLIPLSEYAYIPFPAGTYRLVRWLQPFADAALVLEYQVD